MIELIIPPHRKQSQPCQESDYAMILEEAKKMKWLMRLKIGKKSGAFAIAHCQVEEERPLRFFVKNHTIILNPKIKEKSEPFMHLEGCMSYPHRDDKKVRRYNKIIVDASIMDYNGEVTEYHDQEIEGFDACIYQHEIDHFNGKTIYDY